MALPRQLKTARLTNNSPGNTIDDKLGELELSLADILGITPDSDINAVLFQIVTAGLKSIFLSDAAADPTLAGQIRRNGTALKYHDGSAVQRVLFDPTTAKGDILVFDGSQNKLVRFPVGANGLALVADSAQAAGLAYANAGRLTAIRVYSANDTWPKPAGLSYILAIAIGGGGGGGSIDLPTNTTGAAGGGGGGAYSQKLVVAASLAATVAVVVGFGGIGGTLGADGAGGGDSTFGSHAVGKGGSAGKGLTTVNTVSDGGDGGLASGGTGDIKIDGDDGSSGKIDQGNYACGGKGGGNVLAGSKRGALATSSGVVAGNAGKNYGGGGSGAAAFTSGTNADGGAGAAGVVIVFEYA